MCAEFYLVDTLHFLVGFLFFVVVQNNKIQRKTLIVACFLIIIYLQILKKFKPGQFFEEDLKYNYLRSGDNYEERVFFYLEI